MPRVIKVFMMSYTTKKIDEYFKIIIVGTMSPAVDWSKSDSTKSTDDQAIVFHHVVAQFLFVNSRA